MRNQSLLLIAGLAAAALAGRASGQGLSCSSQSGDCLERSFEEACTGEPSSEAKCGEWLLSLEQSPAASDALAKLLAGAANVALGDGSADAQRKDEYYRRAAEIYKRVLIQEPANTDALTGLATVARSPEEKVAWLRERLEVDPSNIRSLEFLAAALSSGNAAEGLAEAAALTERAYALLPSGEKKWWAAVTAASQYERAQLIPRSEAIRARASVDFGLARVSAELERPELLARIDFGTNSRRSVRFP